MTVHTKLLATFVCVSFVAGCAIAGGNKTPSVSDAVMAGLNAAAPAKLAVSEKFATTGQWPESNAAAGFEPAANSPASVNVGARGLITVTFISPTNLAGKSIMLTPSDASDESKGQVNWSCKGADFAPATLPKVCQ